MKQKTCAEILTEIGEKIDNSPVLKAACIYSDSVKKPATIYGYGKVGLIEAFKSGAEWRESQIPEHISTVQDCELAVRVIKEKAVDILSKVLGNWVHGGDADCIIAEFEEKLNKGQ